MIELVEVHEKKLLDFASWQKNPIKLNNRDAEKALQSFIDGVICIDYCLFMGHFSKGNYKLQLKYKSGESEFYQLKYTPQQLLENPNLCFKYPIIETMDKSQKFINYDNSRTYTD